MILSSRFTSINRIELVWYFSGSGLRRVRNSDDWANLAQVQMNLPTWAGLGKKDISHASAKLAKLWGWFLSIDFWFQFFNTFLKFLAKLWLYPNMFDKICARYFFDFPKKIKQHLLFDHGKFLSLSIIHLYWEKGHNNLIQLLLGWYYYRLKKN